MYFENEHGKWRRPMTHYDRSQNSFGLSREDFDRICSLADEHPSIKAALEELKMLYLLVDDPKRRPDTQCYPQLVSSPDGNHRK